MLSSEDSFVCSICLTFESEITPDWFVTTPNGHVFHFNKCLKEWMDKGEKRCPLCNENLAVRRLTRLFGIDPSSRRDLQGTSKHNEDTSSSGGTTGGAGCSSSAHDSGSDDTTLSVEDLLISSRDPDYAFKIILLGDAGVGKSSLLYRYTTGVFNYAFSSTVGCDVSFKTIGVGGKVVKLSVWDTGGQERFQSISKNFVRNAHGVLLVYSYDGQESESLESIKKWVNFIDECGIPGAATLLVGNKVDVPMEQRAITSDMGHDLALNLGMSFFETSAKDHYNIDAAFRTLVAETIQRVEAKQLEYRSPDQERESRLRLREQQQREEDELSAEARRWC